MEEAAANGVSQYGADHFVKRELGPATAPEVACRNRRGVMYHSLAEVFLESPIAKCYRGKIQLIFTSPPFPLNRKKKYGNLLGQKYIDWLASFAVPLVNRWHGPYAQRFPEVFSLWRAVILIASRNRTMVPLT